MNTMKAVVILAICVMASPAFAQDQVQDQFQDQSQNQSQDQTQGQGQDQSQTSTNANTNTSTNTNTLTNGTSGNVQSVKINVPRQAPAAVAPGLAVSAETCMGSFGIGASSPFGGVSFGKAYKDEECELRMFARSLSALGQDEAALALLATNDKVAAALRAVGFKAAWLDGKERVRFATMRPRSLETAAARDRQSP